MISTLLAKHREIYHSTNPTPQADSSPIVKKKKWLSTTTQESVMKKTENVPVVSVQTEKSWEPIVTITYPELEESSDDIPDTSNFHNILAEYEEEQRRYPHKLEV